MAKPATNATPDRRMILLHVVWMTRYVGWEAKIHAAGFKFPAKSSWGAEMFNFKNESGKCYGHFEVMPRKIKRRIIHPGLHIENLGADKDADSVNGVLVVWTAPDPRRKGRTVIGWYRNATVYRAYQTPGGRLGRARTYDNAVCSYRVVANAEDCVLLPPERRSLTFPPKRQGTTGLPGQFNAYYPSTNGKPGAALEKRVRDFIGQTEDTTGKAARKKGRFQQDPTRRKTIEQAAVDFVWSYFEDELGYEIENRQTDNCGYDLKAMKDDDVLCVEVKGRSGDDVSAEFTRNEYDTILKVEKSRFEGGSYRICIVTDALGAPKLHQFLHWPSVEGQPAGWWTLDGTRQFELDPVISARGSVKPGKVRRDIRAE